VPGALVCGIEALDADVRALAVARGLSERLGLRLVTVHVVDRLAKPQEAAAGRRLAEQAADAYISAPAASRACYGDPVERLVEAVEEENAELLVVGSRGRGSLRSALLGSVSTGVMASSACPVVVVSRAATIQGPRRGADPEPERSILCGVDGSEESFAAASLASDLAVRLRIRLVLTHILTRRDDSVTMDESLEHASLHRSEVELLHRAVAIVSHRISPEVRLERGEAVDRLDELATREAAELIVLGSRGSGRVRSALVGSVATRLAGTARAPVVVLSPHVCLGASSGEYEFAEPVP